MRNTITNQLHRSAVLLAAAIIVTATLNTTALAHEIDQTSRVIWPDLIPIPAGFEAEGIEMGKDQDFFVGTLSWSGNLTNAGAIYKGNLVTGEGRFSWRLRGRIYLACPMMRVLIIFMPQQGIQGALPVLAGNRELRFTPPPADDCWEKSFSVMNW